MQTIVHAHNTTSAHPLLHAGAVIGTVTRTPEGELWVDVDGRIAPARDETDAWTVALRLALAGKRWATLR